MSPPPHPAPSLFICFVDFSPHVLDDLCQQLLIGRYELPLSSALTNTRSNTAKISF